MPKYSTILVKRIVKEARSALVKYASRKKQRGKIMTEKELREIKRRFRPERSNIAKIVGCFVNENSQIIYRINQPIEFSDSAVSERLLGVMKKTLSGSLGTNLTDVAFSTKQVLESDEHKLLMKLRETRLQDSEVLETFYS